MYKNIRNRGSVSLAVTLVGSLIGLGLLTTAVLNNRGLSFQNKENLLAQAQVSTGGIQVDFPSSGSTLNVGQTYTISWSGIDYSRYSTGFNIQLRKKDNTLAVADYNIADLPQSFTNQPKSYSWTVQKFSDGQYFIRIYCYTYCGSKTYADSSLFNIINPIPAIKVFAPNGGETWEVGKTYPISWQVSDPTAPVGVYLSGFDEFGGTYIAETILPGTNVNSTSWVVPSTVKPGKYLIRAVANPNDKTKSAEDSSDAPFNIVVPIAATQSIKVLSPNGGENMQIGKEYIISITYEDINIPEFGIYLFKGGTQSSNVLGSIVGSIKENGVQYGTYGYKNGFLWDVGKYGAYSAKGTQTASPGSDYYICLLPPNVGTLDCSDAPFTITASAPACTPSTSCVVTQYCKGYGDDVKKCIVTNADCSTSSYTTGSCNSVPPPTLTCDATAKAVLNSVGGCSQLDSSRYPNVYKACCTLVTKETLLDMLEKALQDGRIDDQEKADLLRALDNYLSARG